MSVVIFYGIGNLPLDWKMESIVLEQAMDALHILRSTTIRRRDYYTRNIRKLLERRRTVNADASLQLNDKLRQCMIERLDRLDTLEGEVHRYNGIVDERVKVFHTLKKVSKQVDNLINQLKKLRKLIEVKNCPAARAQEGVIFNKATNLMAKVKSVDQRHDKLFTEQKQTYLKIKLLIDEVILNWR